MPVRFKSLTGFFYGNEIDRLTEKINAPMGGAISPGDLSLQRDFGSFEVTVTAHEQSDSNHLSPGSDSHLCKVLL